MGNQVLGKRATQYTEAFSLVHFVIVWIGWGALEMRPSPWMHTQVPAKLDSLNHNKLLEPIYLMINAENEE